jgi:hypothetical protein
MVVNHLKCLMFGAVLVSSTLQKNIMQTIADVSFVSSAFPMLSDWGVKDEDTLIHSLGCSYWMQLGHHLGFSGVVEVPAPLTYAKSAKQDVRADAVWFNKQTQKPAVVVEFERYAGTRADQVKLTDKVKNLLLAHRRWQLAPELLILSYWNTGLKALPDHQALYRIFAEGFALSNGERVEGANPKQLLLINFMFECDAHNNHRLFDVVKRG